MSQSYLTLEKTQENLIVIERSKFICSMKGIKNEDDARAFIDKIRKKHSLATHNCYAYIADDKGLVQKFSDDGEPQGTAGFPMLEVLKNRGIYKTVAVVTRYFGGVKLGTGGLARAYSGSVSECLNKAKIIEMCSSVVFSLAPDYEMYSKLSKHLLGDDIKVLNTEFSDGVKVEVIVKKQSADQFAEKILNIFNGKLLANKVGEGYYPF